MPQVPTYNRQVEDRGIPSVRVNTQRGLDDFGGGQTTHNLSNAVENIIQKVGGLAQDYYKSEQEKADKAIIQQKEKSEWDWEKANIYDPENGAMQKTGQDAFTVDRDLRESWDKWKTEEMRSLKTDRQKAAFDDFAAKKWERIDRWASGHILDQTKIVQKASWATAKETAKDKAAIDPSRIQESIASIDDVIRDEFHGQPPEIVDAARRKEISDVHSRVVDNMLANRNDRAATAWFEKNKGEIDPDRHGAFSEKIRVATDRIKRENLESISMKAANLIDNGMSFDELPKSVIEALPLETRKSLKAYAKSGLEGKTIDTDPATYYELAQMGHEDLKKVNLMGYVDKLSSADLKKWMDIQTGLRGGKAAAKSELDGFRSDAAVVDDQLRNAGIDPKEMQKNKREDYAVFRNAVEKEQLEKQKATGKKLTNEELGRIAQGLLAKGNVQGSGWHIPLLGITFNRDEKRAFQLKTGETFDAPVVKSKEEYDSIPSQTIYLDASGRLHRKK